ncbi:MAG TPA: hypothetical protein VFQ59_00485 [Candidatus Paceibacterota bacterium]|nr:hypothetical protein [Candidatus Paceibacterota bacterium]
MKIIKNPLVIITIIMLVSFFPLVTFGQATGSAPPAPPVENPIKNPIGVSSFTGLLKQILEGAIKIGMPVIALAIIYSGFLFVAAQGNPEKLDTAKKSFVYTLIGAAILLGAWALAQVITTTVLSL